MKYFLIIIALTLCFSAKAQKNPMNDITTRRVVEQKLPLAYPHLDERDLFWEKRIWRVIDVREKMNLTFLDPRKPFLEILTKAAEAGDLTVYDAETDDFRHAMTDKEIEGVLYQIDTIPVFTESEEPELRVVRNELNYEDIKRFRVKEVWFFDSQASVMRVRILGIAPIQDVYDDLGDFKYEKPLFWIHYPSAREVLAKETVFTVGNQAARTTWEDLFERRQFASVIYKESDVLNRRLEDIYSGTEKLLVAEKIKQEMFNIEQDMWSK